MMHDDPYYQTGVWQEVNIQEFKAVVGSWVGGKNLVSPEVLPARFGKTNAVHKAALFCIARRAGS